MSGIMASVQIDIEDLAVQIGRDEGQKLIYAIDLAQADAEFTEQVIIHLIKSMVAEFKGFPDEMEAFKKFVTESLK